MAFNWSDFGQAVGGGAATGAGIGALSANPAGIALGSVGGAGLAGILSLLNYFANKQNSGVQGGGRNQNSDIQQVSTVSPEAQNILQFLLQQGQQGIENPYGGFEPIAQQAQQQFNQQTVPGIAERFASLGKNAISSPAFASQLGQAGAGLQTDLAGMRSQYGQQNKQNAMNMLALGLTPSVQNYFQQQEPGFGSTLLNQAVQNAPTLYQNYLKTKKLQS
jgi:hypothetical protein